jgi:hypothetical protein
MKITKHNPLKPKSEYKRNYNEDGGLKYIDVFYSEIEDLLDKRRVWEAIKFLNENNMYYARFDIAVSYLASKVAKQVLTDEEKKLVKKERELLSWKTINNIEKYAFKWYELFKNQGLIVYDIVPRTKVFKKGNYRRSYETIEVTGKLTDKGKRINYLR